MRKTKLFALLVAVCLLLSAALADTASPVLDIDTLAQAFNDAILPVLSAQEGWSEEKIAGGVEYYTLTLTEDEIPGGVIRTYAMEDYSFEITFASTETTVAAVASVYGSDDVTEIDTSPFWILTRAVYDLTGDSAFQDWLVAGPESDDIYEGDGFQARYWIDSDDGTIFGDPYCNIWIQFNPL